ncbi:GRIP and coiled-coil domain-containing protein 2-like isoform X2 [Daktulosphaira vitifoliae]|uniref:GRIP and coiled-coil domain-containing protein 2-like isoform X2 n=1 Tax=Daktulosphaira vitifoliae TaxID=58002 RepID=UPI0021A9D959|nr:GRIP and coiled-coil domain-containing protein 2-like isoform X2 [Daktulosphaira vitifoliae]
MQHVKPSIKGDPLCPLGFHPQVRWPTRCKRCYRDYKDHTNRNKDNGKPSLRKDDVTLSSPVLTNELSDQKIDSKWYELPNTSSRDEQVKINKSCGPNRKSSSWTSTPDLSKLSSTANSKFDNFDNFTNTDYKIGRKTNILTFDTTSKLNLRNSYNGDIDIITPNINLSDSKCDQNDDVISLADSDATNDTFATVINDEDLHDQVLSLKTELKIMKEKCEKAERDKSDVLLRRLASLDTTPTSRTTASELLKYQEKVNELKINCETLNDDKRSLTHRISQLEIELQKHKNNKLESSNLQTICNKLIAAETKIEELTEENNDLTKELSNVEQEIRDKYREEQDNEFLMLRRDYDQLSKNCRILAFKLKKAERRIEELDKEKTENEKNCKELIEKLENELDKRKSISPQTELKRRPMLGTIAKSTSGERMSRESLTRGDSQEDPVQLQRDLQDSIEREADMREQLRFAEEEAKMLRKKVCRLEEDNETMALQLKKMATKTKYRSSSVTDRDEGISDVEDASELKLLLELSEQEIAVLKRKLEEIESERDKFKIKVIEYQTKTSSKVINKPALKTTSAKTTYVKADVNNESKAIKQFESKITDLETQLKQEIQKTEKLKMSYNKELSLKEVCIAKLKEKTNDDENKKQIDLQNEFNKKIKKLENDLLLERKNSTDILSRFEILQKENINSKSKWAAEKEKIQSLMEIKKRDLNKLEVEFKKLKDTYDNSKNTWSIEKLNLERQLKEVEKSHSLDEWKNEKENMKRNIEENVREINTLHKQCTQYTNQIEKLRKENDNLQKNLDDFEKVVKVQHNLSMETKSLESSLKEAKIKLYNEEQAKKIEIAALKVRYDNRIAILSEEIKNSQFQTLRFKRERDSFKQMLETSEKHTSTNINKQQNISKDDELQLLQQQVSCMEEQLSEARLECSRLKTELVTEKSSWEITKSEMTSRLNKLEEERLLNSGRTKLQGLKAKMELAWQKEREDQQRLLQETSTLARDLRQTLYEVERERDKERLETKRRIEHLTKSMDADQQENRKKVNEIQCDLMDLRDAHAKLRTINEKLRKEKDKIEQECESLKLCNIRLRSDPQMELKINNIAQLINNLVATYSEQSETNKLQLRSNTPTPPARKRIFKSREASPDLSSDDKLLYSEKNNQEKIKNLLLKVNDLSKDLVSSISQKDAKCKRSLFSNRSASSENDPHEKPPIRGSLYRKSLSLEQNMENTEQDIWKKDEHNLPKKKLTKKLSSFDSQQSHSSSKSDIVTSEKPKKKGLLGKLKKLTKSSKSFDHDSDSSVKSNSSVHSFDITTGKETKGKITDIFKTSTLPNLKKRSISPSIFRKSDSSRYSPSPSTRSDEYEEMP